MPRVVRGWAAVMPLLLVGGAAAAEPAVRIVGTELRAPPDSHEPQKARVSLHNAGGAARGLVVACTFQGEDGRELEVAQAPVPEVGEGASAVAEVIYYGWPRASRATCRLAEER